MFGDVDTDLNIDLSSVFDFNALVDGANSDASTGGAGSATTDPVTPTTDPAPPATDPAAAGGGDIGSGPVADGASAGSPAAEDFTSFDTSHMTHFGVEWAIQ